MSNIKLSLACGNYDHTRALMEQKISPEGIDLIPIILNPGEIFWRMLQYNEFDASEMSLSNTITERCKQNPRFIAIPAFPSKIYRHSYIFINKKSGIKTPKDLNGKKVGLPEYTMTATVWQRGDLEHHYGVAPSDIEWYMGGKEGYGRLGRMEVELPKSLHMHIVPKEHGLSDLLAKGEIDALLDATIPASYEANHPDVDRLWPNYKEVEIAYFKKTKIFHIMHTVVIKREIYETHPWVARSLYKAFSEAKKICQDYIQSHIGNIVYTLPWTRAEYESTVDVMGKDFWPYGVEANKPTLDALTTYHFEQGLSDHKISPDEIFAASTLDERGSYAQHSKT